ncbi:MAG: Crp/Fnr family transcriptional regulator [Acidobacteria bacterium]|nr:MAG: Crp/Fnr family transcriptional regulator [Acidobacteriota bacterium]
MNTCVMPIAKSVIQPRPSDNGNRILGGEILGKLPRAELDLLRPRLEFAPLRMHQILHEAGDKIRFAYFVESGLISVVNILPDGKSVEVALVGRGGFTGLPVVDGFGTSPNRFIIQAEGTADRIEASVLRELLPHCPHLNLELHRYGQRLTMQAMQIAACNGLHEVEERLARWLLMSHELLGSNELPLTQDLLGQMLGTRRSSVSLAAGTLHKAGIITYRRGRVTVLDKVKLQHASCECYQLIKQHLASWAAEIQQI